MALTEVRQAMADALSTVEGVTGYTKPPTTARTGDAWPRFAGAERDPGTLQFTFTWRVLVLLAADEGVALDSLDDLVPDLYEALMSEAYVLRWEPVVYTSSAGATTPALEITMIRE